MGSGRLMLKILAKALFAMVALAVLLIGPAHAQQIAEAPTFVPGEVFTFEVTRKGRTSLVERTYRGKTSSGHLEFERSADGKTRTDVFTSDLAIYKRGDLQTFEPHNNDLKFPLSVGAKWSLRYKIDNHGRVDNQQRNKICRATDFEPITVRAGEFAAFKIKCENWKQGASEPRRTEMWYAPEIGSFVKARLITSGVTVELVSHLKPNSGSGQSKSEGAK